MSAVDVSYRINRNELLARCDLGQVLDSLTPGAGDRRRRRWRCPETSHLDEHPSVSVSTDRHGTQRWRCWSGGHGGTAVDAVMAARQLDVGDAIRWLNDHHAHLEPVRRERSPSRAQRPTSEPSPLVTDYVERCEQLLWTHSGADIRSWLDERGLDEDVLRANRVGADPGRAHLHRQKGLPSGWPAAVFPALDPSGNVTFFQARFLDPHAANQKYTNPARSLATNPRLAWTQPVGTTDLAGPLIVTEGIPDALIAASAGMRSVGVLGTTTPSRHVAKQLRQAQNRIADGSSVIVVCFDADHAGRTGAARLTELLAEHDTGSITVEPPDGKDLSDWAATKKGWSDDLKAQISDQFGYHGRAPSFGEASIDVGP